MNEHGRDFFEQMATCRDAYRRLGDAIYQVIAPCGDVLDLGAGLGYVAGRLNERGIDVMASDLYAPETLCEPPAHMWLRNRVDLKAPMPREMVNADVFDVVICTETAEHIPEAFADAVVASVARRARSTIVWSAASLWISSMR